ncbi:hypothetical protein [Streptomyces oceani]|uniref:DUF559 domain-containing protein n=1 Tax=Streptomyces oceani TaxID=1075402 RepID=A0A1E7KFT9_9ACTN|nr:hypothetical protein [Streptomyces oceani]OEV02765.1 hypothetical protein AN216_15035 [Streptomyces oceani]
MTHNAPHSARLHHPNQEDGHGPDIHDSVLTARALRAQGVSAAEADRRCRPGGPWQLLLPGVYLLRAGPAVPAERLRAGLLYAGRRTVPAQPGPDRHTRTPPAGEARASGEVQVTGEAQVTGMAALALHGFRGVPALPLLECVDVLVPHTRRLRSAGFLRVVRTLSLPEPEEITGLPVAPVHRALTDTARRLTDGAALRELLMEAVHAEHCEATAVVSELRRAGLLDRPEVAAFAPHLLSEGRAISEGHLYGALRCQGLPEPCWNVELRLPDGPPLGGLDAYWPGHAVALEIDELPANPDDCAATRAPGRADPPDTPRAYRHAALERLGISVVRVSPALLRDTPDLAASLVRTALMAAEEADPAAYVEVLPR